MMHGEFIIIPVKTRKGKVWTEMNKRIIAFVVSLMILCSMAWIGCGRQESYKEDSERNEKEEELTDAETDIDRNAEMNTNVEANTNAETNRNMDADTNEKNGPVNIEFLQSTLSYSEQKEGNDTIVSIGSLTLTLPMGWQIEIRQGDGMTQYVLVDVHSQCENEKIEGHKEGYEHEIVITPYEIPQMPEDTLQLAAAMKEYFPVPILYGLKDTTVADENKGCWMYGENRDTEEKEYFLFSQENLSAGRELFHIRESNIYAYNYGVEAFWEFLDEGLVHMNDVPMTDYRNSKMEYYYYFNRKSGNSLFAVMSASGRDRDGVVRVYQQGNYDTPVASLTAQELYPERIGILDVNMDGNEDFVCNYRLLNPLNSLAFVEEEEFDGYLWDEEQNTFLYTAGDVMLAQYGDLWKRKNDPDSQRGAKLIPEGLIDYLSEHLLESREEIRDVMMPLVSDRELTLEEVQKLAGDNIAIKNEMLYIASAYDGSGIWLQVDADNDGIEDIYLSEYLGGSLGSIEYYLFTGREDGSYELTDRLEELRMEFAFIEWEGKNYLAKTTWNFTKKVYDGISLECYEEGIYQGGVWLAITPKEGKDGREIQTSYLKEEKYSSLEEKLLEFAKEYQAEDRVELGTAETENEEADYKRSCDIDNDGEIEEYRLYLWQTTNYYTVDNIYFEAKEEEIDTRVLGMINEEKMKGIPLNMWIDKTEFGNVVFILYEEGLYDFHICGWLMSETGEEKLIQLDCQVQTEVAKNILGKEPGRVIH